jgi:hypothetical protein
MEERDYGQHTRHALGNRYQANLIHQAASIPGQPTGVLLRRSPGELSRPVLSLLDLV